jgi:hypothetical protein
MVEKRSCGGSQLHQNDQLFHYTLDYVGSGCDTAGLSLVLAKRTKRLTYKLRVSPFRKWDRSRAAGRSRIVPVRLWSGFWVVTCSNDVKGRFGASFAIIFKRNLAPGQPRSLDLERVMRTDSTRGHRIRVFAGTRRIPPYGVFCGAYGTILACKFVLRSTTTTDTARVRCDHGERGGCVYQRSSPLYGPHLRTGGTQDHVSCHQACHALCRGAILP